VESETEYNSSARLSLAHERARVGDDAGDLGARKVEARVLRLEALEQQAALVRLARRGARLVPRERGRPRRAGLGLGEREGQRAALDRPERLGRLDGAAEVLLRGVWQGGGGA
jgi:hypothetical protein